MLLTREKLRERLIALHQASLELVKDVSLETLLERIATVASEQAEARYAALGVLDDEGKLEKFISFVMTYTETKRMAPPPMGKGLMGYWPMDSGTQGRAGMAPFQGLGVGTPSAVEGRVNSMTFPAAVILPSVLSASSASRLLIVTVTGPSMVPDTLMPTASRGA